MEPAVTPSDRTDRRGFVGRERELVLLDDATDDARAGHGRVALIAGGAGIGKTRLVTELGRRAESRGGVVLWGRCYESEGAPAFWPWQQVIRDYFECHDPAAIASDLGVAVDLVSQMVPGLQAVRATHQVPADLEPIQARFQQFDAVTSFLRAAAATHARRTGEPLLILLDDLHWADEPSLLLLQFVARHIARSPLLILGTYRDVGVPRGHPLTQALGELAREPLCRRVVLPALSEANVAEYLLLAAPDRPRACAFAPSVYRVSEGIPS